MQKDLCEETVDYTAANVLRKHPKSTLLFLNMLNLTLDLNLDFETFFDHDFSAILGVTARAKVEVTFAEHLPTPHAQAM